jgi:membrane protease YdiL (CAAX protease family)
MSTTRFTTLAAPTARPASPLRTFVARHPISSYLVVSFTVGWSLLIPALRAGIPTELALPVVVLFSHLLPATAITAATDGPAGLRALFSRVLRWRVSAGWYLLAAFALPAVTLLAATAVYGTAPIAAVVSRPSLILAYLATLLMAPLLNLAEETGWMGFVQARLQDRHGALAAAALTAPLFALIHLPILLAPLGVTAGLVSLLVLTVFAVPFRILVGWLYNRTGSLIIVAVFHAAFNGSYVSGILDKDTVHLPAVVFTLIGTAVLGGWVAWRTRGRLGLTRVA